MCHLVQSILGLTLVVGFSLYLTKTQSSQVGFAYRETFLLDFLSLTFFSAKVHKHWSYIALLKDGWSRNGNDELQCQGWLCRCAGCAKLSVAGRIGIKILRGISKPYVYRKLYSKAFWIWIFSDCSWIRLIQRFLIGPKCWHMWFTNFFYWFSHFFFYFPACRRCLPRPSERHPFHPGLQQPVPVWKSRWCKTSFGKYALHRLPQF